MFDLTILRSAIDALKQLSDLAKSVKGLVEKDREALRDRIIDAQERVLATQAQMFAMLEEVGDLKRQIAEAADWKSESARYQLVRFKGGAFAFEIKPQAKGVAPAHYACAACYQRHRISILQGAESATYGHSL